MLISEEILYSSLTIISYRTLLLFDTCNVKYFCHAIFLQSYRGSELIVGKAIYNIIKSYYKYKFLIYMHELPLCIFFSSRQIHNQERQRYLVRKKTRFLQKSPYYIPGSFQFLLLPFTTFSYLNGIYATLINHSFYLYKKILVT